MIGCRYGAKNTLVKNYLWFAERLGVQILPERTVDRHRADRGAPTAPTATGDARAVRRVVRCATGSG